MRARAHFLLSVVLAACGGEPGPADGGVADGEVADSSLPGGDAGAASWRRRGCSVTLRYAPAPGAVSVLLAGDFTSWGAAPLPMRDDDGDGLYEITVGPEHGLVPGQLHAYRFVVDGAYLLDPDASFRKYDGACVNSALLAPACAAGPEIAPVGVLATTYDAVRALGRAEVAFDVRTAVDRSPPATVTAGLDGATGPTLVLDPSLGRYLAVAEDVPPGRHVLSVRASDAAGRAADPIDMPFWIEAEPFEWRDAAMYMALVDRFANGEPASDAPVGVEYPADFHGGDLRGVAQVIRDGYLDRLGVRLLWLSPVQTQADGHFPGRDDGHEYAGYHGYWPRLGRGVDARFGGSDALREVVDEAHRHGIRVLFDLISNQVHAQHQYVSAHPSWFRTGCVCGIDPGCGWSERPLDCLFASYLPDIDWTVPAAETQFLADAASWIETYGVDGFRIDAVKHVETNAIYDLRGTIARRWEQAGYRHYLVGETAVGEFDAADYGCGVSFADGYGWLDAYVGPHGLDGQFDFPTNHRLDGLVDGTMGFDAVEAVVADASRRLRPEGLHVRFLGTHDTARLSTRAARDPAAGCRWPDAGGCAAMPALPSDPAVYARLRRALAVLYTMPGIPFVYAGDEIALPGGNDPDNRRDLPWDGALAPVAMSAAALTAEQLAFRDFVSALGQARRASVALRRGRRIVLAAEPDVYAVAWAAEAPGQLAVMVTTRGAALAGRALDGLGPAQLSGVAGFDVAAGAGALRLEPGDRLRVDLPAGEVGLFLAR